MSGKLIGAKKEAGKWLVPMTAVTVRAPHLMDGKLEQPALPFGKTFGDRLRSLRKNRGLSQYEMAKLLGYKTGASISNMEKNEVLPDIRFFIKIGKLFKIDLHQFILGALPPIRERWESGYYQALKTIAEYAQAQIVVDVASPKETHD